MLGKIYVTPTSTPEKLQSVYELVAEALELKIAPDATTRNALTKLHTALGKAVGETATKTSMKSTVPEEVSEADENNTEAGQTMLADTDRKDQDIKMEDAEEEGVKDVEESILEEGPTYAKDSILDELLDDGEEEL